MGAGITFWGRAGQRETLDALAFLKQNRYVADQVLDVGRSPPTNDDLRRLAKGPGGLWPFIDPKNPSATGRFPAAAATSNEDLVAACRDEPALLRCPILLTPKGGLSGFRERQWREFLDIGRGRS